jgi:toxin ParE1/3/4
VKLAWTTLAVRDLHAIRTYVEVDDALAAQKVLARVVSAVEGLVATPAIGRPGRVPGTLELVLQGVPYIVAYRVSAGVVELLRVLHTSRRWPHRL